MRDLRILVMAVMCAAAVALMMGSCSAAEFRGAWLTAWTPAYLTKDQADATVAAAKKAGLNALFIQVRKNADSYYKSDLEPRGADVAPDFDPLAYLIQKAHSEGMQVHAWAVIYRAWTAKTMPTDPNNIVNKHPDWININKDGGNRASEGIYLDPGVPEVRAYIVSVLEDIVKRYDIDGIHYDYIRYPSWDWGYSPTALKRYYSETGATEKPGPKDPKWLQWRRDQVSALVQEAHDRIKAIRPDLLISASTVAWGDCPVDFTECSPYTQVCQDWKLWMSKGWVDVNCPMVYKTEKTEKSAQQFRNWLSGLQKWDSGKATYVGIDIGAGNNSVDGVVQQIEAIRKYNHEGFALFSFNASQRRTALVDKLSTVLGPAPALPIAKPADSKSDDAPVKPNN